MFTSKLFSDNSDTTTRLFVGALLLLGGLLGWRLLHPATTFAADGLDPDWDQAVRDSRSAEQPAVVLFTANWCPTCQALSANIFSRPDVREELNAHYTFVKIDLTDPTPAANARASKFGVSAIPTLIRYDRNGHESSRIHYLAPDDMLAWLRAGE